MKIKRLFIVNLAFVLLAGCESKISQTNDSSIVSETFISDVVTDETKEESSISYSVNEETSESSISLEQISSASSAFDEPISDFKFTQSNFITNDDFSEYMGFLTFFEKSYLVPGLAQKIIPQGMDVWEEKGWMLISGYFEDKTFSDCSVLLAIDINTGDYVGEYYLTNTSGKPYSTHVGGIAVTSKNVYISNSGKLHRIPLTSIIEAGNCGEISIVESLKVPVTASFCNYSEGYLWVGDFYCEGVGSTDTSHHMNSRDGQKHFAWTVGYELDETTENEFKEESVVEGSYLTPDIIFSTPDRIQGFTATKDIIILSQSYGRSNDSNICFYSNPLEKTPHTAVELNDKKINLYFLDSRIQFSSFITPPMSEAITVSDGILYILYESGADKYANFSGKCPTENIWKMILE